MRIEPHAEEPREAVGLFDRLGARERGDDRAARGAEHALGLVEGVLPGETLEGGSRLPQWIPDPVACMQVLERETPLVAEPALVDLGVVAGEDPLDASFARGRADVAADRAKAADGGHVLDLPRSRFEAVLGRGERPDRAELDHVAREGRAVRLVFEGGDHRSGAALDGDELAVFRDCLREARAAVTEDAALAVESDRGRDRDRLLEGALVEGHARRAGPVAEGQVLEGTLAALVADGAVERVVDEDELERRILCFGRQLGGERGLHGHPLGRRQRAGGLRLGRSGCDLAKTHAAGPDGRPEPWLVTEDRDLDPGRHCRFDETGSLRHRHLPPVDRERDQLGSAHSATVDRAQFDRAQSSADPHPGWGCRPATLTDPSTSPAAAWLCRFCEIFSTRGPP